MKPWRGSARAAAALLLGSAAVPFLAPAGGASTASSAVCSSSSQPALAARLTRDIQAAQRGRVSAVAVGVDDPGMGMTCWLNGSQHFDSASVVKVTILGALLRKAEDQHRYLTRNESLSAAAMITRSDNNAASALWADLGRSYLQHFLNLAQMRQTALELAVWGLTQITAQSRWYCWRLCCWSPELGARCHLARSYGVGRRPTSYPPSAGVSPPAHHQPGRADVKNGWLPRATYGWRIHSIGCFTGRGGDYSIAVLTQDNASMAYGVATVEAIARVINRDLNPGTTARTPSSVSSPSAGKPDETIPALPNIP